MIPFSEQLSAFGKAGRDLFTPAVFWRVLWPPFAALLLCVVLGVAVWTNTLAIIEQWLPTVPWSGWAWLSQWAAVFLLLAGLVGLFYLTTVLLVALIVLPGLIALIAARDYAELGRHGENVFFGSLLTTLVATLIYLIGVVLTLPLLLIPGAVLFVPLLWTAWLNQHTFRYDALADHATRAELRQMIKAERSGFFVAGLGCAVLAQVPFINLLVPGYTALVFVHLGLSRLRDLRQRQGVHL